MARKLQIEHLLDRMPGELSGGQQQRVSMARALVKAFGAKPVLVVPQNCVHAVEQMAPVAGLHLYHSVEEALAMPFSVGMEVFTKNAEEAEACADAILAKGRPAACIAIEAPGANELGQNHNAVGKNTTAIDAKSDILFVKCQQLGVWNLAVGDLGNELGMGAPFFCKYLCPQGVLEGALPLSLTNAGIRAALGKLFTWKACILLAVIMGSVVFYRPFCKWLCPLGAFYALLNKVSLFQMRVDTHKCVSCGACARACKMDVDITKTPNHAECIRCGMCMKACPTDAIQYKFGLGDQSNTETTKE